jgi:Zn-dependent protease with chaperone function
MDFFDQQDLARRKTGQLIFLFFLGVCATLVAVNIVCFVGFWVFYQPTEVSHSIEQTQLPSIFQNLLNGQSIQLTEKQSGFMFAWKAWWGSNLNWQISLGVLGAVLIGTVFRYFELAGGGHKVAQWAGATLVDMSTRDPQKKQLINLCEEMAIAAGMSVPELYVMEREGGINAFVAGFNPDEAVLVVTKGALEHLSRDQLQGVIGHEYSHILNGDMRINVRLMSFLAGLVMIGQIGRFLIDSNVIGHRSYRTSRNNGKAGIVLIGVGLVLAAVGYVGVLIGRMIKAAVSRQREFLADASSVQFTRNPDGLAGALYSIKEHQEGSQLGHRHAEDMSHFCFGETVALSDKLATHPPVTERIKRISPHFIAKERSRRRQEEPAEQSVQRTAPQAFETAMAVASITAMVGQVTPDHVQYAQNLYQNIPEQLKNWVHQSAGAKAYLYCQIMLGSGDDQQAILNAIKQEDGSCVEMLRGMWSYCQQLDQQLRLPILELVIPTLKRMSEPDRVIFMDRLERLVALDGRVDFIEWVTITMVKLRLKPKDSQLNKKLSSKLTGYDESVCVVLAVFVSLNPDVTKATELYQQIINQLGLNLVPVGTLKDVGYERLDQALRHLNSISFMWRKVILQACADIVQSDGRVEFLEYEALRVVADCMESPLPLMMIAMDTLDDRDTPIPFEL